MVINEASGYLYVVGSRAACEGGLHVVNISTPTSPVFVTCYTADAYIHDAQCLVYMGPDVRFHGHELCFCFNEDTFSVVDVTDKANITRVSQLSYIGAGYVHQGWVTEDMSHVILDDELDEYLADEAAENGKHTVTRVLNVQNITSPFLEFTYVSSQTAIGE